MKSQWVEFKETAITLRQGGQSLKTINHSLGIPLSTLSGWLKDIEMSNEQRIKLSQNKEEAWKRAHQKAADWHRTQKALRDLNAKREAQAILERLDINSEILDVVLAVLLFGDGRRKESTPLSSSDPKTLLLILTILQKNYGINLRAIRFDLSIRADQDKDTLKAYWAKTLNVSPLQFKSVTIDKRTAGKPTIGEYKGVCIVRFSSVAIQRKLRYLYNLFYERITEVNLGT